jgi:hypothetical protein
MKVELSVRAMPGTVRCRPPLRHSAVFMIAAALYGWRSAAVSIALVFPRMDRMTLPHTRLRLRWLTAVAGVLILAGCGEKTEQEQLEALRDSLTYTQYRRLSHHGLPASYNAWREGMRMAGSEPTPELTPDTECMIHGLLGYSALSADRSTIAIAESDIVDALPACRDYAQISAALRSVAFHRREWPQLAEQQSEFAINGGKTLDAGQATEARMRMLIVHAALGYKAITDKRWDRAQVHIDAIALSLKQPWLSELGRAGLAINNGDVREGLVMLKRLSENPQVPPEARAYLGELIGQIEAETGDVDSSLWMARVFTKVVWGEIKRHGPDGLASLMEFVDQQSAKVDQLMGDGKGMLDGWWQSAKERLRSDGKSFDD